MTNTQAELIMDLVRMNGDNGRLYLKNDEMLICAYFDEDL